MKRLLAAAVILLFAAAMAVAAPMPQQSSTQDTTSTTKTTHTRTSKEKTSSKIDVNSASQQELEALPGIGPATSAKIVQGRPYRAKSDLVSRKILSRSEYAKIKNEIVAHQTK
jgi:DNA uptake protein ComE-like DNA-binding protein